MATLHVRDVPDDLYEQIKLSAMEGDRSISARVIDLLQLAIRQEAAANKQRTILGNIVRRRKKVAAAARAARHDYPDVVELIREDRDR
jgi:plasmid stability protein